MAKAMRRTAKREAEEKVKRLTLLVKTALDDGNTTKRSIANVCEIKEWELNDFFKAVPEIYALYVVRRKSLVDKAADNIEEIVNDKEHPQHFQASKYVLQNYKSDLDIVLESQDEEKIEVEVPVDGKSEPILIRFGQPSKKN